MVQCEHNWRTVGYDFREETEFEKCEKCGLFQKWEMKMLDEVEAEEQVQAQEETPPDSSESSNDLELTEEESKPGLVARFFGR